MHPVMARQTSKTADKPTATGPSNKGRTKVTKPKSTGSSAKSGTTPARNLTLDRVNPGLATPPPQTRPAGPKKGYFSNPSSSSAPGTSKTGTQPVSKATGPVEGYFSNPTGSSAPIPQNPRTQLVSTIAAPQRNTPTNPLRHPLPPHQTQDVRIPARSWLQLLPMRQYSTSIDDSPTQAQGQEHRSTTQAATMVSSSATVSRNDIEFPWSHVSFLHLSLHLSSPDRPKENLEKACRTAQLVVARTPELTCRILGMTGRGPNEFVFVFGWQSLQAQKQFLGKWIELLPVIQEIGFRVTDLYHVHFPDEANFALKPVPPQPRRVRYIRATYGKNVNFEDRLELEIAAKTYCDLAKAEVLKRGLDPQLYSATHGWGRTLDGDGYRLALLVSWDTEEAEKRFNKSSASAHEPDAPTVLDSSLRKLHMEKTLDMYMGWHVYQ